MIVAVARETYPDERRVAVAPVSVPSLLKAKLEFRIETTAGQQAGFPDSAYIEKGASIVANRRELLDSSDVILTVRGLDPRPEGPPPELAEYPPGKTVIGFADPLASPESARRVAERGLTTFALELIPRVARAQSMDALSSMATISGYKAVLLAADALPRMFPMLMTAAGTVTPARVFVIGAGVAGLMAIATAHRLGAVVHAYDVRPAVKEEVESVGAKFVELPLPTNAAQDARGYAKAQDDAFYRRQREMMAKVVAESDVVIATAAVPGQRAPILVTHEMVAAMRPGSVIVDLAAEHGGNCELTRPGETVLRSAVTILGPLNLPSTIPHHASQLYSRNVTALLLHMVKDGEMRIDPQDEIVRETLLTRGGEVVHPRVRELLGLKPLSAAARPKEAAR